MQIVNRPCGFTLFSDMHKTPLEQIFVNDACLINYLSTKNCGHWTGVTRRGNLVKYFNPSGAIVDDAIDFLPREFRAESKQDEPHLLKKLVTGGYQVEYMDYPLQTGGNYCGRLTGLFLRYPHISIEDFIKIFKEMSVKTLIMLTNALMGKELFNIKKLKSVRKAKMTCKKLMELIDQLNELNDESSSEEETPIVVEVDGGALSNYREFVKMVNALPMMKTFKGKGKRSAQSMLFKKSKQLSEDEFLELLAGLEKKLKKIKPKPKSTLEFLTESLAA